MISLQKELRSFRRIPHCKQMFLSNLQEFIRVAFGASFVDVMGVVSAELKIKHGGRGTLQNPAQPSCLQWFRTV